MGPIFYIEKNVCVTSMQLTSWVSFSVGGGEGGVLLQRVCTVYFGSVGLYVGRRCLSDSDSPHCEGRL